MKNITVYDIAREANVSVSTVSRVLNDTAPVKASTREKVNKIIKKYQFQPNALARSLISKATGTIGIIVPDITNPFFPEVFKGAETEARAKGYTFFLCDTEGDYERESEYLSILKEKRVDGIVFLGGRINLARCSPKLAEEVTELSKQIPVVLVNGNLPKSSMYRVMTDEAAGAELATRHLIEMGHRDIAFLGGYDAMSTTSQKVKAYKRIMKEAGLPVRPEWIIHDGLSIESGKAMMGQLIGMKERPSAVLCVNDFTAVGAVKEAIERGLRIPEDISVVGYDDTHLSTAIIPELTTVTQHTYELGKQAVQILHQLINREETRKLTLFQPELVVRQSTGPYHELAPKVE
ncbi:substrate-binding domain-containing protein [Cohnella sp. CFH 77786]|uniref:LacI family DNA-binding transcriptional regulator n=1 Tax=Cohnella sp. CFH 77786 TaxID=2662265 RepID=UPI001C60F3F8|nr:LacI family DNA-binding transcriptional regulator [Cohnella sp. CFH 77786]MBW5445791.1 substrate-binding domain-containing protein [Cohnella sp. CFH 77786]